MCVELERSVSVFFLLKDHYIYHLKNLSCAGKKFTILSILNSRLNPIVNRLQPNDNKRDKSSLCIPVSVIFVCREPKCREKGDNQEDESNIRNIVARAHPIYNIYM